MLICQLDYSTKSFYSFEIQKRVLITQKSIYSVLNNIDRVSSATSASFHFFYLLEHGFDKD
ncbi:CLUMA_CG020490, isoform A [Clunio marinus]|uniref:CLUMA_CG020490, isoform A n=1 Tax=Clunio marinus TaxID=568069 RepID=A0A1J1J540_9DIPT|nr:CLUMA_CG020490, isoform A [Clunio marinus]